MAKTVKELKEEAKNLGIKGYYKMKREELVEAIEDATIGVEVETTVVLNVADNGELNGYKEIEGLATEEQVEEASKELSKELDIPRVRKVRNYEVLLDTGIALLDRDGNVSLNFYDYDDANEYVTELTGDKFWCARSLDRHIPIMKGLAPKSEYDSESDRTKVLLDKYEFNGFRLVYAESTR